MNDYKVLFVGGLYPKSHENEIINNIKKNPSLAANAFQWGLVNGLDSHLLTPVTLLNETFIGSYPKNYRKIFFRGYKFSHCKYAEDISLSFLNLTGVKNFIPPLREKKCLKQWLTRYKNKKRVVFFYSLSPAFIRLAKYIRKQFPEVVIIIDILDLIEYTSMSRQLSKNILHRWLKLKLINGANKSLKHIDGAVVVSKKIIDKLGLTEKPYTVVECVVEPNNECFKPINEKRKSIVYAGTLTSKYGVMDLVHAFIDARLLDYTLDIYGDGEDRKQIEEYATKESNINYHGFVSHSQMEVVLTDACILVNPRKSGQDFTEYSFPIKTADYLKAGRPVIGYKLDAFPEEYDKHIIYIENFTNLVEAIKDVCSKSIKELNEIGRSNYNFIKHEKNSINQTYKIIKLIDNIYDRKEHCTNY